MSEGKYFQRRVILHDWVELSESEFRQESYRHPLVTTIEQWPNVYYSEEGNDV